MNTMMIRDITQKSPFVPSNSVDNEFSLFLSETFSFAMVFYLITSFFVGCWGFMHTNRIMFEQKLDDQANCSFQKTNLM